MASQVTNYKCPACTGPLHFVGASGKLECDFCGGKYDVADIEKLYAEKESAAAAASFSAYMASICATSYFAPQKSHSSIPDAPTKCRGPVHAGHL